ALLRTEEPLAEPDPLTKSSSGSPPRPWRAALLDPTVNGGGSNPEEGHRGRSRFLHPPPDRNPCLLDPPLLRKSNNPRSLDSRSELESVRLD
ncbi:hypothetical protein BHE74_00045139, partial [Ensete ventricosum]